MTGFFSMLGWTGTDFVFPDVCPYVRKKSEHDPADENMPATEEQINRIRQLAEDVIDTEAIASRYSKAYIEELTQREAASAIKKIERITDMLSGSWDPLEDEAAES